MSVDVYFRDGNTVQTSLGPWASSLIGLGARLARLPDEEGSQLYLAISVPTRELVGSLLGVGWVLTRPIMPGLPPDKLHELQRGERIAVLNGKRSIVGTFFGIRESLQGTRLHLEGSEFLLDRVEAIMRAAVGPSGPTEIPAPGAFIRELGHESRWPRMHLSTHTRVLIVGTKQWIEDEIDVEIGAGEDPSNWNKLRDILRPSDDHSPTWQSEVVAASSLDDVHDSTAELTILDGNRAASWIRSFGSRIVVVVLDRSVDNEIASTGVMQLRSTSAPISIHELGWQPPAGVEVLAFRRANAVAR